MWKDSKVVLYEGPTTLKDATEEDLRAVSEEERDFALMHCTDTLVTVNGEACYVYDTNVNHSRAWEPHYLPAISRTPITYFDFEGAVRIEVRVLRKELTSVKISPLKYEIEPEIDCENQTITFTITKPDTYTVTFNDRPERALHIFANPLETDVPDIEDENVIYIGPGEWNRDEILLKDGQTLYLAGGAVLHGVVNADFAKNITVMGRGIIDGSHLAGWKGVTEYIPLKFDNCEDVTIKDVIVLNSSAWVCQGYNTRNGVIDGLKIISARPNSDGVTLQSCENYEVQNCFVRSWDDSLVIKNYDRNTQNIHFRNMQLWTDLAQSMEVGYETNKGCRENASIRNVSFEQITVLNNFHKPVISVHNADDALVTDILFKDIVVEYQEIGNGDGEEMPYLIDINIAQNSNWSTTKERGTIANVTIEDVNVLAGNMPKSRIKGYDSAHKAEAILIKNLVIRGQAIRDFETGKFEIDKETTDVIIM